MIDELDHEDSRKGEQEAPDHAEARLIQKNVAEAISPKTSVYFRYFWCFVAGVVLTYALSGAGAVLDFMFVGDQIQCQASFPRRHTACLYSRFGLGDQSISFHVDGKTVYSANDVAGGNLNEKISWDAQGRKVSLEILGRSAFLFDADSRLEIKE